MPSLAFQTWTTARRAALDDIESAHRTLRGSGPGVRAAIQQINQACALMLSAQFQAFCRYLHTESVDHLLVNVLDLRLRTLMRRSLMLDRKLDRGNPNPGNIGADFGRLDLVFWTAVLAHRSQNAARRNHLEELNAWRNAIAHQDFAVHMLRGGRPSLSLTQVQTWRRACEGLAESFDEVMRLHLQNLNGRAPW